MTHFNDDSTPISMVKPGMNSNYSNSKVLLNRYTPGKKESGVKTFEAHVVING